MGRWMRLLGFSMVVFGPMLGLGRVTWAQASQIDWTVAFPIGRRGLLLLNSLGLAVSVAVLGVTLGLTIALALWQSRSRWSQWVGWGIWMLVPVPPYLQALAWGPLGQGVLPWPELTNWLACAWVQWLSLLPLAIGLSWIGLRTIDLTRLEAAQLLGSDLQMLHRILLPLLRPLLLAAVGLLTVLSLTDYSVPSLFGVSTYALEIFAEYSATGSSGQALAIALPLILITSGLAIYCYRPFYRVSQRVIPVAVDRLPLELPQSYQRVQQAGLVLLGAQLSVPLIAIGREILRGGATIGSTSSDFLFSLGLATGAALLCLPLALGFALELRSRDGWGQLSWLLLALSLAIPGPLVGVGLIALWQATPLYGQPIMPLLALLARFTPFAALVLLAQLQRLDPSLTEAAQLLTRSRWRRGWQIELPLLLPGLLAAAGLVFALSLGELGATLLVIPPGYSTLALRIYTALHSGAAQEVAILCLILSSLTVLAGGLLAIAIGFWSRLLPQPTQIV